MKATELIAVFDALRIPAVVLDDQGGILATSAMFAGTLPVTNGLLHPGQPFADVLRALVEESRLVPGLAEADAAEWLEQHVNQPSGQRQSFAVMGPDGRCYLFSERVLDAGGSVLLATDVTQHYQAERQQRLEAERYKDFVDVAADWVWEQDAELRTTFVSDGIEAITGVPAAFYIGKTRADLRPDTGPDPEWDAHVRLLTARQPYKDFYFRRLGDDGRTLYTVSSGKPIFDANGAFQGYRGTARDITQMMESRQRLVAAIDSLHEAFVLTDADENIVIYNRRFAKLNETLGDELAVGVPYEKVLWAQANRGLFAEAKGCEAAWVAARLQDRRNPSGAFELRHQDGSWLLVHHQRLEDGSVATIAVDITQQKEAEAAVRLSEERLGDFARTAADWYWEQDADLRFTYVSIGNADISGMTADEHFGKTRRETNLLVDEDELLAHEALLEQRLPFLDFRFSRIRPDGSRVFLSTSGQPRFDENGRFLGYRGSGRDITKLTEAQANLEESERRFRDIAQASSDFFWETDRDHRFTYFSAAMFDKIGLEPRDRIGKTRIEVLQDGEFESTALQKHLEDLKNHQPFRDLRYAFRRDDDVRIWVSVSGVPIFDEDGVFAGYRGTTTNITESVAADRALMRARDEANAANDAKSEFLSSMSHELRTPLNAVLGFAQVIESEVLPQHRRAVGHILKSGNHLLNLINQVLDFSRIETGDLQLISEIGPVHQELEECLLIVETLVADRGIEIECHLDGLDTLSVIVDKTRFKQVLLNLLSNAIKYNEVGGKVSLHHTLESDGMVKFVVKDNGRGIALEQQAHLFQPFNRLGVEATDIEGVGIGLVLSKRIAEAMGGSIGFDSTLGKGSTFWFACPQAPATSPTARPDAGSLTMDKPLPSPCAKRVTVLYVEDNPANLALMTAILGRDPRFNIVSAMSGRAGLKRAGEVQPDIILLDIQMADMDGFGLLEALRAEPKFAETPILAVSAAARPSDIERGTAAGFQAYLAKPLNVKSVLETINQFASEQSGAD